MEFKLTPNPANKSTCFIVIYTKTQTIFPCTFHGKIIKIESLMWQLSRWWNFASDNIASLLSLLAKQKQEVTDPKQETESSVLWEPTE